MPTAYCSWAWSIVGDSCILWCVTTLIQIGRGADHSPRVSLTATAITTLGCHRQQSLMVPRLLARATSRALVCPATGRDGVEVSGCDHDDLERSRRRWRPVPPSGATFAAAASNTLSATTNCAHLIGIKQHWLDASSEYPTGPATRPWYADVIDAFRAMSKCLPVQTSDRFSPRTQSVLADGERREHAQERQPRSRRLCTNL